ncbi:MAG: CoA transferase [Dehalococcoidia bacterium]
MRGLSNLRVIEISVGGAVPWLCKHLSWHGAEIVRIEMRAHPDAIRTYIPPSRPDQGPQPNLSPWHPEWHSGKSHVGIDLEAPRGQDLLARLVSVSDALLTNLGASACARLGLSYDKLRALNPSIIFLQNTAFGVNGPYTSYKAWGLQTEAVAGLSYATRHGDETPILMPYVLPDWMASLYGLVALTGALRERNRTGRGQFIDLSMLELTVASMGGLVLQSAALGGEPQRWGNQSPVAAPHNCYPCKGDDRWCVITVETEQQWVACAGAMGRPQLAEDRRFSTLEARLSHRQELDELIAQWTRQRDGHEVMRTMHQAGVPAGVVQDVEGLLKDEHLRRRGFFVHYDHLFKGPVLGGSLAIRMCPPDGQALRAGNAVGEDNEPILKGLLGLAASEYQALDEQEVISQDRSPKPTPA